MGGKRNRQNRSVVDYESENALRKALMAVESAASTEEPATTDQNNGSGSSVRSTPRNEPHPLKAADDLDWVLPSFDPETTEVQSMKEELHRLQVLKSYLILDSEPEEAFDRITGLGARMFNVPICLVSLVDLGRQWFMSNRGLGDVRETPRKLAFCAHAIHDKRGILVVPDAKKDFRFKDTGLVTGPPHIRFYGGAPLISPEGYKLGTFCVIDGKPRPDGLASDEESSLKDLAAMCVKAMVDRRYQLQQQENPAQLIAYTAHDLMTPLTGVQLSLSLLKGDEEFQSKLNPQQRELLSTAANCSELMFRMARTAVETLRQGSSATSIVAASDLMQTSMQIDSGAPVTKLAELVKSLIMIMEPIPKLVPLVITLDPTTPETILGDDLKLFRSALNLASHAINRTSLGLVHLKIYPKQDTESRNDSHLVFECEDTGSNIEVEEYQYLFQPSRTEDGKIFLGLSSVASLVSSMNGEYGFRPGGIAPDGKPVFNAKGRQRSGAVFWFSVPLYVPENTMPPEAAVAAGNSVASAAAAAAAARLLGHGSSGRRPMKIPVLPGIPRTGSRGRMSYRVGDTYMNDTVSEGCLSSCDGSLSGDQKIRGSNIPFEKPVTPKSPTHFWAPAHRRPSLTASPMVIDDAKMPAAPQLDEPRPVVVATPAVQGPRKRRALVIDDSLVVRKSLALALKKLGYAATQAVDGLEGLKKLKETMFDLTFCDFLMPVMDGMDCVKQYREWERQNRPRFRQLIIGFSAHASANDSGQGIEAGMDDFRPKPISIKTLTDIHESDTLSKKSKILDELEGQSREQTPTAHIVEQQPPQDSTTFQQPAGTGMNLLGEPTTSVSRTNLPGEPAAAKSSGEPAVASMGTNLNLFGEAVSAPVSAAASAGISGNLFGEAVSAPVQAAASSGTSVNLFGEPVSAHVSAKPRVNFVNEPVSAKPSVNLFGEPVLGRQNALVSSASNGHGQATRIDVDDDEVERVVKRSKTLSLDSNKAQVKSARVNTYAQGDRVCLIATDTPTIKSNDVWAKLEGSGWKVVVVHESTDALRLLQMRNWDVVLIDDDVPEMAGTPCICKFRQWEDKNRVNRQRNVFLVCDGDIPAPFDRASIVQPPSGLDGVLRKPLDWKDLQHMIQAGTKAGTCEIIVR